MKCLLPRHLAMSAAVSRLLLGWFIGSVSSLSMASVQPVRIAEGLAHPWALAFLDQGRWLVSERAGRLRIVHPDGRVGPPLAGLPPIDAGGQGGLLDVVSDRDFARNRRLFICYAEPAASGDGNSTALPMGSAWRNGGCCFASSPRWSAGTISAAASWKIRKASCT
jgi:hypothetical protein